MRCRQRADDAPKARPRVVVHSRPQDRSPCRAYQRKTEHSAIPRPVNPHPPLLATRCSSLPRSILLLPDTQNAPQFGITVALTLTFPLSPVFFGIPHRFASLKPTLLTLKPRWYRYSSSKISPFFSLQPSKKSLRGSENGGGKSEVYGEKVRSTVKKWGLRWCGDEGRVDLALKHKRY